MLDPSARHFTGVLYGIPEKIFNDPFKRNAMRTNWTPFMPLHTRRILVQFFPLDIAKIIVGMAHDEFFPAWDPYGLWTPVPEYDRDGAYGYVPQVNTCLPLF